MIYWLLQKTLSSLELPRAVSVASESSLSSIAESSADGKQESSRGGVHDGSLSVSQFNGRQKQKFHDPALSIQVLEKFSLVTKFARDTTSQLFRDNHNNGFNSIERRSNNDSHVDYPQKASNIKEKINDETHAAPVAADPLEVLFYLIS